MKPAFQKDASLLDDIRRALSCNSRRIWWLGQSGFLITRGGQAFVFDPYLSDSLTAKYANSDKPHVRITERVVSPTALGALGHIELITSSHNHTDHLDAETLLPLLAANPAARLLIPVANRNFVLERLGVSSAPRLIELDHGTSWSQDNISVTGIASAHPNSERDEAGRHRFLGYVIQWPDLTIYHSGDTVWHEPAISALRHLRIDIALLPINGDRPERRVAGNLDGPQAARFARAIGARLVIPCHYDLFEFNTASPDEFVTACQRLKQRFHLMQNGEGLDLD